MAEDLAARVAAWIADDPDPRDRDELTALAARAASPEPAGPAARADLADRFAGRLEFGTAGLRGVVAAGPNRMNRAVVRGTTAALARWLRQRHPDAPAAGVVIGCDARHRSAEFAAETAATAAGAGLRVYRLPPRLPTPVLAFAVRHLAAAAGVMITASHNPPADNGYKLYLGDGAQIIPPTDAEIEAAIGGTGPLAGIPLAPDSPLITSCGDEVVQAYLDGICALVPGPGSASTAGLRFVYTPLHGVAGPVALRAFARTGYPAPDVVSEQADPDPDFPTVAFPNPEEPGALDLALALARRREADLVLANDPDGDRLAVAVPDPAAPGGWRALTGDQLGALLGAYVLDTGLGTGPGQGGEPGGRLTVTTIVSATLLGQITAAAGAVHARTLTGFKWIVRGGEQHPGTRFVFGYEEALGYAVGGLVRDKDGISAALAVLGLAAQARSAGRSLLDVYDALETRHGVHLTAQLSVRTATGADIMGRLRATPPDELGRHPVRSVTDLAGGTPELPASDVVCYELTGGRVVIRPSGTEPKIKAYLEVVEPVTSGDTLAVARQAAQARLEPLRAAVRGLLS